MPSGRGCRWIGRSARSLRPHDRAVLRVLIADDQALVRAGFRMILEAQPDIQVVAEASDGDSALRLARRHRPDIVLMDVRMPGLDGLEATRRLLAGDDRPGRCIAPRVILTTFDLDEYVYAALQSGASGFLLKDVSPEHLVGACGPWRSATRCSRPRSRGAWWSAMRDPPRRCRPTRMPLAG